MKKKWLTGILAGVMAFSGTSVLTGSAHADENVANDPNLRPPLIKRAEHWGIDTQGKTDEEIKQELRKKWKEQGPKWKEKREQRILEHAKRWGVDTEGKTMKEIVKEINKKRKESGLKPHRDWEEKIKSRAEKRGINTDGKTIEQICKELWMQRIKEKRNEK